MHALSRRSLLRHASQMAALGVVVSLLEACGGSSAAPTATSGAVATPLVFPTQVPQSFPTAAAASQPAVASPSAVATTASASQSPVRRHRVRSAGGPVKDASFTVVDGSEPNSLDPRLAPARSSRVMNGMYEGLVAWDEKLQLQPMLAVSWQPSADGKQWTFKLRQGVKFHDGTPFTVGRREGNG